MEPSDDVDPSTNVEGDSVQMYVITNCPRAKAKKGFAETSSPASRKVSGSSSTAPGSPDLVVSSSSCSSSSAALESLPSGNDTWDPQAGPLQSLQMEDGQDRSEMQSQVAPDNNAQRQSEPSSTESPQEGGSAYWSSTSDSDSGSGSGSDPGSDSNDASGSEDGGSVSESEGDRAGSNIWRKWEQMRRRISGASEGKETHIPGPDEITEGGEDSQSSVSESSSVDDPDGIAEEGARVTSKSKTIWNLDNVAWFPETGRERMSKHHFESIISELARNGSIHKILYLISLAQADGSISVKGGKMTPLKVLTLIADNMDPATKLFVLVIDACYSAQWIKAAKKLKNKLKKCVLQVSCESKGKSYQGFFTQHFFQVQDPKRSIEVYARLTASDEKFWNGDKPDYWASEDVEDMIEGDRIACGLFRLCLLSHRGIVRESQHDTPEELEMIRNVPWHSCWQAMRDAHRELAAMTMEEPREAAAREEMFYELPRLVQEKHGVEDAFWKCVRKAHETAAGKTKDEIIDRLVRLLVKKYRLCKGDDGLSQGDLKELAEGLDKLLWTTIRGENGAREISIWEEGDKNLEDLKKKAGAVFWVIIRKSTKERRNGLLVRMLVVWFKTIGRIRRDPYLVYEAVIIALKDYRVMVHALAREHHQPLNVRTIEEGDLPVEIRKSFDMYLAPICQALRWKDPTLGDELYKALLEHWALTQELFVQKYRDSTAPTFEGSSSLTLPAAAPSTVAAASATSWSEQLQKRRILSGGKNARALQDYAEKRLKGIQSRLEAKVSDARLQWQDESEDTNLSWMEAAIDADVFSQPLSLPCMQWPLPKQDLVILCTPEEQRRRDSMQSLPSTADPGSRRASDVSLQSHNTSPPEQQLQLQQQEQPQQQQQIEDSMQPADSSTHSRSPTQARGSCCNRLAQVFFMHRPQPAVPEPHRPLLLDQQQ